VTARVVTIDDVPIKQALAQLPRDAQAATPEVALPERVQLPANLRTQPVLPGQAWTPPGPVPINAIQPLSATVLTAPPLVAGAPTTNLATFLPGSELGIRVVSVQTAPTAQPSLAPVVPTPTAPTAPTAGPPIAPLPVGIAPVASANTAQSTTSSTLNPATQNTALSPAKPAATTTPSAAPTPLNAAGVRTAGQTGIITPSATPGAQVSSTTAVSAPPTPIQSTETLGLKLATPQGLPAPSPSPPKTVESAQPVVRMTGQVSAVAANGAAVIQTPAGEVQLNLRANLPVGSTVTFDVLAVAPPRPDAPITPPTPTQSALPLSTPTTGWGTLTEAVQVLQRTDPQAASQLAAAIPDGGPRTAVATMAFVQAMRSGDARTWPGDSSLRALERAGPRGAQLAAQLSGEVKEMASRASEPQGEWRTTPMPWNLEGRIERVNLVSRREGDSDDEAKKKSGGRGQGTRFLINLDLSRLGSMQLDGMFVKGTRAFDMMVRTKEALPENIRRDLSGLFADSNAAMGLKGTLSFQVVKAFPDPTKSRAGQADRGGVWA
jgi:hypothetical protein